MTAAVPAGTVTAFLRAIHGRLSPTWDQRDTYGDGAYHHAAADVQRAIAAVLACGCDPARVQQFTRLLNGQGGPGLPPGHGENHIDNAGHATLAHSCEPGWCITCGGHADNAGNAGNWHPAGSAA